MNENLNLCEILKGHEGENFYSPFYGKNIKLYSVQNNKISFYGGHTDLFDDGSYIKGGECMLFPSKYQRDWNKWIEENKPKIPKTWSDTRFNSSFTVYELSYIDNDKDYVLTSTGISPIERSALALLKIHQLIEVGYGGNISIEEWNNPTILKYVVMCRGNNINEDEYKFQKEAVAFHTAEQRKEFLSYPENIELLKDYFMIS